MDVQQVKNVFPYGICDLTIVDGGGLFSSGIALPAMQDRNDEMVYACMHACM